MKKKPNWPLNKLLKVNVATEAVSPNVIHDKCDSSIFGPSFECKLTEDATEPKLECIEDCGITKYICDCNVYRYLFLILPWRQQNGPYRGDWVCREHR